METTTLSEAALSLLRLHIEQQGRIAVDDSTREPYRELARAGLMMAGSTFRDGSESIYVLTKAGFDLKAELMAGSKETAAAIPSPPSSGRPVGASHSPPHRAHLKIRCQFIFPPN